MKVSPNARRFALSFKGGWRVSVVSPPEKGKANAELIRELSRLLSCQVRVAKGASSKKKVLEVGLDGDEFCKRTEAILGIRCERDAGQAANDKGKKEALERCDMKR